MARSSIWRRASRCSQLLNRGTSVQPCPRQGPTTGHGSSCAVATLICSCDARKSWQEYVAGFLEHGLIADVRSKPNTTMRRMKVMAQSARPTAASTHTGIGTSSRQPSQMSGRTGSFLIRARQPGTSWIVSRKKQWPDCNEQSHKHHQHSLRTPS